jgi:3-dehydroquinate dehydratase/shikimate dehydrogenase
MTAICVSLTEASTEATLARMEELAPVADLFEVRADFAPGLDLAAVRRAAPRPLLLTCRPEAEGGRWSDADAEGRLRVLRQGDELGFGLVDVELRSGFEALIASRSGRGLVLSFHDHAGMPEDLDGLYDEMAGKGADVVKIVGTPRSVSDLGRLLAFARRRGGEGNAPDGRWKGLVALAMGPLGVASRVLGGRHGAPFTYAAPVAGREAAPGQLTARDLAETYRVRAVGPSTRAYGILGVDILRSLSPAIHNRAFAERDRDAVYVPLQADSLESFLEAREDLDLSGFSITRPWKSDILPHLGDRVEPSAARAASVNTVVVRDGEMHGSSTDGDGVLVPLRHHLAVAGHPVTIIGAGGAARAAAFALVGVGARVRVLARRGEQAAAVAADVGCAHGPLEALDDEEWDVLINATPVGSGACPGESPVPASSLRPGSVVFDMVYEPRETPLLRAAREAGCRTIDGVEMLVAQAVGQFEAWTGVPAPVEEMTEAALAAIARGRA